MLNWHLIEYINSKEREQRMKILFLIDCLMDWDLMLTQMPEKSSAIVANLHCDKSFSFYFVNLYMRYCCTIL